jgi:hypothetical protein
VQPDLHLTWYQQHGNVGVAAHALTPAKAPYSKHPS